MRGNPLVLNDMGLSLTIQYGSSKSALVGLVIIDPLKGKVFNPAFPAGLFSKRSGRTVGFGIGLLFSLFYWCMMFAGHTLGIKSDINSFMAMWIPNFVILFIALVLYIVRFVRR